MRIGFTIFWIFCCLSLFGQQVSVQSFPIDWQLFPRDVVTNQATINIAGEVVDSNFQILALEVSKDSIVQYIDSVFLSGQANEPFIFTSTIQAELANYSYRLLLADTSNQYVIQEANQVVAGDVFLIQGQSNAYSRLIAGSTYTEPGNQWVRSFGSTDVDPVVVQNNLLWYPANAITNDNGRIGIWGMEMAIKIRDFHQIPVAIMNGALGATSILTHGQNTSLNSIYGRLLYRCQQAGVDTSARAIFWWQGERDCSGTTVANQQEYYDQFVLLQNAWQADFPGLQNTYITQIHTVHRYEIGSEIREAQRQLSLDFPEIVIQSSHNLPDFDGFAHHSPTGYLLFADWIFHQVQRDIYNSSFINTDPPKILSAKYTDGRKNKIELEFTQPVNCQDDTVITGLGLVQLEDYFMLDNLWGNVDSAVVINNTIELYLAESVSADHVSYLPGGQYHNSSQVYDGPWITNDLGIGAISFYEFPIEEPESVLQLKLFLEGSYMDSLGKMRVSLNTPHHLLPGQSGSSGPVGQPYAFPPWNYMGSEGMSFDDRGYNGDVVDWVLVSLRTDISADSVVYQAACLLDSDGRIRLVSPVAIKLVDTDSFYVVVEHRNHIGVMSANKVPVMNCMLEYDFTTQNTYTGNGGSGSVELTSGVWALFAGDGAQFNDVVSYDINGEDRALWEDENGAFFIYNPADYNMDGEVSGLDRINWLRNNGVSSRVPK